jgi:DNA processing protein
MPGSRECAAVLAVVQDGRLPRHARLAVPGDAYQLLEQEHGLLAQEHLRRAARQIESWSAQGISVLCALDAEYPENLRSVHDRPPLIFLTGRLLRDDARSVAVIGSRRASSRGLATASAIAEHLTETGYTVVSGLAAGIDTAVHTAALACGGRTVAVLGTGVSRFYPPENRALQDRVAHHGAVISRFWPDTPPTRENFPLRNAVMSGISLASVVVEATRTSGSRLLARLALAQGRPVLLLHSLLEQEWARELAEREGVYVIDSPSGVPTLIERLTAGTQLV